MRAGVRITLTVRVTVRDLTSTNKSLTSTTGAAYKHLQALGLATTASVGKAAKSFEEHKDKLNKEGNQVPSMS